MPFGLKVGLHKFLAPDPTIEEPKQITDANFKLVVDPGGRSVTVRIPKSQFSQNDFEKWGFAVVILGQEGYPAAGVWRVVTLKYKVHNGDSVAL